MPNRPFNFRRYAALLVALLALVIGSCQAQQSLRHSPGMETPPALYKGKAAAQTACVTAQQQPSVAPSQVAVAAEMPFFFRKSAPFFPAADRLFPLPRQGLSAACLLPFYILFKRLKLHV